MRVVVAFTQTQPLLLFISKFLSNCPFHLALSSLQACVQICVCARQMEGGGEGGREREQGSERGARRRKGGRRENTRSC